MQPILALLGRANVGKSTLFNRLTQTRDAIVADFAGLTRDRHYGKARLGAQECIVIDTGGLEPPEAGNGILQHMARQTQQAAMEADVLIFVLDARQGLCAQDQEIARWLRRLGKPCLLAANKAEGMAPGAPQLAEFFELGLGEVLPLSAAHGQGVRTLAEQALALLAPAEELPDADEADETDEGAQAGQRPIRLAVAGRPNVGKSTLINTWLGEERLVAFDQPGTTRDTIRVPFEHQGQKFELMDTAGLRRKGRVFEAVEKFSLIKTLQAIEGANVVVLLIDALEGVTDQDAHIAGFILESGRGVVLAVNKCDALDGYQRQMLERSLQLRLAFLPFAPPHFISAQKRQGLQALWRGIFQAQQCATCKMPTPVLTRVLLESVQLQAPKKTGNRRPKLRYAHQGGMNPPRIIIHGNNLEHITQAYKRFLEGRFRKQFNIVGTPLFIEMKSSQNPYADRR